MKYSYAYTLSVSMSIKKSAIILFLVLIFIYAFLFLGYNQSHFTFLKAFSQAFYLAVMLAPYMLPGWLLPGLLFPFFLSVPLILLIVFIIAALTKKWKIFWFFSIFLIGAILVYSLFLIFLSIRAVPEMVKFLPTRLEKSISRNQLLDTNSESFKNDLNKVNYNGHTPLLGALQDQKCEIANSLISQGADFNIKHRISKESPLMLASRYCTDVAKLLIQNGANINDVDDLGRTPLYFAESAELAALLIEKGADVNHKDTLNNTPLMGVAFNGNTDVVKTFLTYKATVNNKDNTGITALMLASRSGHLEIIKLLVQNNADVNLKDKDGRTALWWATIENEPITVDYLKKMGAE